MQDALDIFGDGFVDLEQEEGMVLCCFLFVVCCPCDIKANELYNIDSFSYLNATIYSFKL